MESTKELNKSAFDIEITSYCQAECYGCQRNIGLKGKNPALVESHMLYENFCKLLDSIDADLQCEHIEFCGEFGDPMMHPDIERFIERASHSTSFINIHTNGGLRQPKWYSYMAEKHIDYDLEIKFGIDGCDHNTNWKYRKGVHWERAMDNLRAWTDAGGKGHWAFLLFDWNYHQIPQAVQMANDIGCKLKFHLTRDNNGLGGMSPHIINSDKFQNLCNEYNILFD